MGSDLLATITNAQAALDKATTPQQTKAVEAMSAAAMAWAKEQRNYELFVGASLVYIEARRKTTELLKPSIRWGGNKQGTGCVTLTDFHLTKNQWARRVAELEVPPEGVTEYFDHCISYGWEPSPFGMVRYNTDHDATAPHHMTEKEQAAALFSRLEEFPIKYNWKQNDAALFTARLRLMARDFFGIGLEDIDE